MQRRYSGIFPGPLCLFLIITLLNYNLNKRESHSQLNPVILVFRLTQGSLSFAGGLPGSW